MQMIPIERGKVMGAMTPERSLAVCCPRVAAMWHAAKNKGWTPLTISSASDLEVWWICAAGHEWSEQVRSRTAPRRWKGDDVAACGLCTGFHVLVACACGKQRLAKAAEAGVSYECVQCWSAKERERARWARRRARARTDFNPTLAECDELARSIAPTHLPPVLTTEWCRAVVPRLYEALLNERGYGKYNTLGAVEDTLRRLKEEGDLLPAIEQLRAAHAAGEPIEFMRRRFWTQGVLHVLGLADEQPPDNQSALSLHRWLRRELGQVLIPTSRYSTSDVTSILTGLVLRWGLHDKTGPWRGFLELVPPFIPTNGYMSGRVDVVLTRLGSPDLVVEIDSAHKPRSMEKLQFAYAAGATAVWVRWREGTVRKIPGVHVIDLVNQTRTVTSPG
ncbi:hypothetical protein GCM10023148_01320 [Actinokineospora soli]